MNSNTGSLMSAESRLDRHALLFRASQDQSNSSVFLSAGLTERVVEGVGDRFIPLALEEGQACGGQMVLVLSVEIHRFECTICQRVAVEGRQRRLSVLVQSRERGKVYTAES